MRTARPSPTVDRLCTLELQRRFLEQRADERAAEGKSGSYSLRCAEAISWLLELYGDADDQCADELREAVERADAIHARRRATSSPRTI